MNGAASLSDPQEPSRLCGFWPRLGILGKLAAYVIELALSYAESSVDRPPTVEVVKTGLSSFREKYPASAVELLSPEAPPQRKGAPGCVESSDMSGLGRQSRS